MANYKYNGQENYAITLNGVEFNIEPNSNIELTDEDYAQISWSNKFDRVPVEETIVPVEPIVTEPVVRKKSYQR